MLTTRVGNLRNALHLQAREGVVVHNPSNIFYLSGYTGEGLAFLSQDACVIVTDFRYTEQAEKQAPDFICEMTEKGRTAVNVVSELCKKHGLDTLYYEPATLTVSDFDRLQQGVAGITWKPLNGEVEKLRQVKDEGELALIRAACKLTGEAFERLLPQIHVGMTEKELALMLDFDMLTHGASGLAFSTIVAAGANGSLPHAVPGDYKVQQGDMITFDFGAKVGGYCADMTRTVAVGEPSAEMRRVYQVVLDAHLKAHEAVAAGKCCRDIDQIARDYIDSQGYAGRFGHGLGHAVGIDIHEDPRFSQLCDDVLKAGQVLTVEPGIYLPGIGGVRIENTVIIREGGCEALTLPTRELIIL